MALRLLALVAAGSMAVAPPAAAARQKPVTGTVMSSGVAVVAIGYDGKVTRSTGSSRRLRLVPPARRFTLHLRDGSGRYRGPVVAPGRRRGTVVTGFRAGAKLGKIRLRNGYAVTKRLRVSALDPRRTARASTRGVPLGADRLGLVRAAASGGGGPGLDPDRDGIPGTLDVDDDGDTVLDNVDATARSAAHPGGDAFHPIWLINLNLGLTYVAQRDGLAQNVAGFALNRHARNTANDDAAFDRASALTMRIRGELLFPIPEAGSRMSCAAVPWCGRARDLPDRRFFPQDFSPETFDGQAFGVMEPVGAFNPINDGVGTTQQLDPGSVFGVRPKVDRTEIVPEQQLFLRLPDGTLRTAVVGTIFGTVPALQAWSDGGGSANTLTYPIPEGDPGSPSNPAFVKPSPDGDYRLTMSVWRPQRPPELAGETDWIDLGQLDYEVVGRTMQSPAQTWRCPERFHDDAQSAVLNRASVVTFTVNVSECLRRSGLPAWDTGQPASEVFVAAKTLAGDAAEGVGFAFRPAGTGQPSTSGNFSGTWRANGGTLEWTIRANRFATDHFRIRAHNGYSFQSGSTPSGFTCELQTIETPNDVWACSGGTFAPGSDISGTLQLNGSPGTLFFEVIAPSSEGGSDTGYPMTQQP